MPTNLDKERQQQKKWKLKPRVQDLRVFDKLLDNEFLALEDQAELQAGGLRRMIEFAAAQVPYYRDLFESEGLSPQDIRKPSDLQRMPILGRQELREQAKRLQPIKLPRGERFGSLRGSSGTTGIPVRVVHSVRSQGMFPLLKQREYRWFRFDPEGVMGWLRTADIARRPQDDPPGPGETARLDFWPAVGPFFKTGPYVGSTLDNPVPVQADWVERLAPNYLVCGSGVLEHLAFAFQDREPPPALKGYLAIASPLSPGMRGRIENTFGAPVDRNYGLNEIGIVAARCPEGGRYHVHTEHCLVEIVDDDGEACAPGEAGHLLVTSLTNAAMPLIRYDSGDIALTADGPCPCGRTLPSFKRVIGRHKLMTLVPAGTLELADHLRAGIEQMPPELAGPLRQYQVYHDNRENFELRVVSESALPDGFFERCKEIWRAAEGVDGHDIKISVIDDIPISPGGKYLKFDSDFYYPDRAPAD